MIWRVFLIFVIFIFGHSVFAMDIVYPKTNPVIINAPSTFFIGSVREGKILKMNGIDVEVHKSGAFAQTVQLQVGKNNFELISGDEKIDFVIERRRPAAGALKEPELMEYPPMAFKIKKDNAPLRTTPVDGGINRMSHLQEGIPVFVNGEKGDFYRIYLNSKLMGWILKTDLIQDETCLNCSAPVKLIKEDIAENDDFCFYKFELEKKVPFLIREEKGVHLELFNLADQVDGTKIIDIPMERLSGWEAYYEGEKFILKVRKPLKINLEKPFKHLKIVIDAGHGGDEFGAIGCLGNKEKDINLEIAKKLKEELEKRDAKVYMTRDEDISVSLKDRVDFARAKEAAILLSIHANALPDGGDPLKCRGTSVYYYHNQAKPLANSILNSITTKVGTQNDKVRQGSLALTRPTSSLSVLVEVAYMINPDDNALLTDKKFQNDCAKAIADGIEDYLINYISK